MLLYSEKEELKLDPPYQRMGGVWTLEKKQLFIDSILNDYDIPKIYFHKYSREKSEEYGIFYAVIDGRQRLETIWQFIEGDFTLSKDFDYQRDLDIKMEGLSYEDIAKEYPRIKIKFDSYVLPVVAVETDDEDLIEDMFSRLNEAAPLNAAEKRNAFGGEMVKAIRKLSKHDFFSNYVSFSNKRYQYLEVSSRFLLIENSLSEQGKLMDTKKVYLDSLVKKLVDKKDKVDMLLVSSENLLNIMIGIFTKKDPLLKSQGNMVLYYLLVKLAERTDTISKVTRKKIIHFHTELKKNRELASTDMDAASFELLEYDRLTQQGTNDASNIKERLRILADFMNLPKTDITDVLL